MALEYSGLKSFYIRFKPHLLMGFSQICYAFLNFITEASLNHGMNPNVYITYRHIVAGVFMFPFAYFLERKQRRKLTITLFVEIFVISLLGVGLSLNLYFVSLKYTTPAFVTSMVNTIFAITFVIAVLMRLEALDLGNRRGIAKVLGTLFSLAGGLVMTLYRGQALKNPWPPLIHIHGKAGNYHEDWVKGSILISTSCITWSLSYIMQAFTLRKYPAPLSLTTWMSFLGAAQSAVFTVIVEHRRAAWTIGFNIDLWSTLYGGVVISGLIIFIQLWCTEEKGPVFVAMFNPFLTVLVTVLAYLVVGEKLYVGSIIGGVTVIIGLYMLLWGKEGDIICEIKSKDPESLHVEKQGIQINSPENKLSAEEVKA
ncbi:hypothetical protein K2173_001438 [Erythroxylum novogranatense]|uniref:WAT1-related protein n=1 Tax=Erythroxylum novogranatense TaxID=1862640 RepID=A0AAV8T971_9ROSI|nr:hypothetical protein K2173_001438 [Erythroxylum novogranatense]